MGWACTAAAVPADAVAAAWAAGVPVTAPDARASPAAEREGTEGDLVFAGLKLAIVVKDEHQMGDVLAAKAIGYLPGVEHNIQS
jgi:hypothetical protein